MTLYAPADIAVGHSLLYLNYAYVSIAIVWVCAVVVASVPFIDIYTSIKVYDYIITFDDEVHILIASIPAHVSELNHYEAGIST
ncbi:hypothetical protein K503DRAFT_803091 [Rhizopogon vinicolor AM-OR11-026]|uniref:Uncharacterized protein n=1 Tax=Rhizopogon vinicolor AM-OR11-026 TaxID=1314800 RepID=A0A1B7MR28_9AGAM|nr:hypothetical protein K503DRAFT_803091 [Rhizopogon vinicolor AM-OR11-026]